MSGCATKVIYKPDCSTKAVNRAQIAGIKDTRIAMGMGKLKYGYTPGHIEAQKLINGKWLWLRDSGGGVVATDIAPRDFTPLFYFDTQRFIELEFFPENPEE